MFTEPVPPSNCSRDELTNLPDRRSLNATLEIAHQEHSGAFGVILIDLDGLKRVNDSEGHAAGDELIQKAASVLHESVRQGEEGRTQDVLAKGRPEDKRQASNTAARYAGDEFVVVISDVHSTEEMNAIRERLQLTLAEHDVEASLGSSWHRPGQEISALLAEADARMYNDKRMRKLERYTAEQLEVARLIGQLSTENEIALADLPALQKFLGKEVSE